MYRNTLRRCSMHGDSRIDASGLMEEMHTTRRTGSPFAFARCSSS